MSSCQTTFLLSQCKLLVRRQLAATSHTFLMQILLLASLFPVSYEERFVFILQEHFFWSLSVLVINCSIFQVAFSLAISNTCQGSALCTKHTSSFVLSFLFSPSSSLTFFWGGILCILIATSTPFETKQNTNFKKINNWLQTRNPRDETSLEWLLL